MQIEEKSINNMSRKATFAMKLDSAFIIKTSVVYCVLSVGFSFVGLLVPEKAPQPNPLSAFSIQEVTGHIIWGLVVGAASFSIRYCLLSGSFALLIDSDHLIGLLQTDALSRMSHSILFGIISILILMILFGKKNYLLGAIAVGGLLAHLSYDMFVGGDGMFPLFTPFYNEMIRFPHTDWIFLEIAAIVIVGFIAVLNKYNLKKTN